MVYLRMLCFYKVSYPIKIDDPENNNNKNSLLSEPFSKLKKYLMFNKGIYKTYMFKHSDKGILEDYYDIFFKFYYNKEGYLNGDIEIIVVHKTTSQEYICNITCTLEADEKFSDIDDFLAKYKLGVSFVNIHKKIVIVSSYFSGATLEKTYYEKVYVYDTVTGNVDDLFYDIFTEKSVYISYSFPFSLVIIPFVCVNLIENGMVRLDAEFIKTKVRQLFKAYEIGAHDKEEFQIVYPYGTGYLEIQYIKAPYTIYVPYDNFFICLIKHNNNIMRYTGFTSTVLTKDNLLPLVATAKSSNHNTITHDITLNAAIPEGFLKTLKRQKRYLYDFVQSQCKQYLMERFDTLENAVIYKKSDGTVMPKENFAYKCLEKIHEIYNADIKFIKRFYIISERHLLLTIHVRKDRQLEVMHVLCEYKPEKDNCNTYNMNDILYDSEKTIVLCKKSGSIKEICILYKDTGKIIEGKIGGEYMLFDEVNNTLTTYESFKDGTILYQKYKVDLKLNFIDNIKEEAYKIEGFINEIKHTNINEHVLFYCDHNILIFDLNGLIYQINMYDHVKNKEKIKKISIQNIYRFIYKDKKYAILHFFTILQYLDNIHKQTVKREYASPVLILYEKEGRRNLICGVHLSEYQKVKGNDDTVWLLASCVYKDYNENYCALDMMFDYLNTHISTKNKVIAFDTSNLEYYPLNFIDGKVDILDITKNLITRIDAGKSVSINYIDITKQDTGYYIAYLKDKWIPVLWHTYEAEQSSTIYYAPEYKRTIIPESNPVNIIYAAQNGYNRYVTITVKQNNN